jgi:replication initiation protein RepC
MVDRLATTPFGGAPLRAKNFIRLRDAERRQERLRDGEGGNETGTAEKWQLIRALTEARDFYGLSDRSIAVLEALTSFHQDRRLDGKAPIIVFPSNAELSIRCRGMSPATLRRHLAALVDTGFIFRRDSANGKRYAQRNDSGVVETAFGFDLAPLALRAAEIFAQADAEREMARRVARLRAEMTLHLRDVAKTIEAALHENRKGEWETYSLQLVALSGRVPRVADTLLLKERADALLRLRAEVEAAYLESLSEEEMSANESTSERHIQNSNTDQSFELNGKDNNRERPANAGAPQKARNPSISLKQFLTCCPQLKDYARDGIKSWADVVATADLVRSMLGISPSAWAEARKAMGEADAAIVIAAILERAEDIRSPGGYLRDLTRKAEKGRFSVQPMLKALMT